MKTDTKQKLIDVTAQACALIHEQLPKNAYIVAIFDDKGKSLANTFRGEMSETTLTALIEAAADGLAEASGVTRKMVFAALLAHKSAIVKREKM